jgi:hypothetical protein
LLPAEIDRLPRDSGCGTIYKLTPPSDPSGDWSETVLYSFEVGGDGKTPAYDLLLLHDNLYGVMPYGGGGNGVGGTAFQVTP